MNSLGDEVLGLFIVDFSSFLLSLVSFSFLPFFSLLVSIFAAALLFYHGFNLWEDSFSGRGEATILGSKNEKKYLVV